MMFRSQKTLRTIGWDNDIWSRSTEPAFESPRFLDAPDSSGAPMGLWSSVIWRLTVLGNIQVLRGCRKSSGAKM